MSFFTYNNLLKLIAAKSLKKSSIFMLKFNTTLMKYKIIALLLTLSSIATAQFRKYSNEFLNIGAGARAMGMGSAQVASSGDGTSTFWNPAGLTQVKDNPVLTLQHAEYFGGIGKYDFASLVKPAKDQKLALGISLIRFAIDDIPNTLFLVNPADGSVNYGNITTFSNADYAVLVSLAKEWKKNENKTISIGGNAKIIYRSVGSFAKAWGFGLDLGIQSRGRRGGWGIVAKDVTSTFNAWTFNFTEPEKQVLYVTKNDIPLKSTEITAPRLSAGGYHDFIINKKITLKAEGSLDITFDGKRNTVIASDPISIDPHLGLELAINKSIYLRGGITNFQQALADKDTMNQKKVWIYQPSAGVGFKIKDVTIDYAFANLANQSEPLYTHIVSLSLALRKQKKNGKK